MTLSSSFMFPGKITFSFDPSQCTRSATGKCPWMAFRVQVVTARVACHFGFIYDPRGALLIFTNIGWAAPDNINSLTAWYSP